jgi:hypothetical protein
MHYAQPAPPFAIIDGQRDCLTGTILRVGGQRDMEMQSNLRIMIDRAWTLDDLYQFPRTFQQAYSFWDSVIGEHDDRSREGINHIFAIFPWQGGSSAVHFFDQLKRFAVPPPKIVSIHYQSPGWLELGLIVTSALTLSRAIKQIASTIGQCNATYDQIYRGMKERKILRLKTELELGRLEKEHLEFIAASSGTLAKVLGFAGSKEIDEKTKNQYVTLKILMTVYRRVGILARYEDRKKAIFPDSSPVGPKISSSRKTTDKQVR